MALIDCARLPAVLIELLKHAMHFWRVFEAVEANGDSNHFWMGSIIVLGKPLDEVGVIQDLPGMATLIGHAKIVLARHQNVRFADVWLQQISENFAIARRINVCVNDGHLTMIVEFTHKKYFHVALKTLLRSLHVVLAGGRFLAANSRSATHTSYSPKRWYGQLYT